MISYYYVTVYSVSGSLDAPSSQGDNRYSGYPHSQMDVKVHNSQYDLGRFRIRQFFFTDQTIFKFLSNGFCKLYADSFCICKLFFDCDFLSTTFDKYWRLQWKHLYSPHCVTTNTYKLEWMSNFVFCDHHSLTNGT